jgi:membrane protein required for colicin V production
MAFFDIAVLLVILLSALLGWWRGFMYELFSLLGWIAAYIAASSLSDRALPYIPDVVSVEALRSALAFALVFVVTLIVAAVAAWLLSKLTKFAGLSLLDGKFGAMFGVLRGFLVVLALVWVGGLTSLPEEAWWKEAWSSKPLHQMALYVRDYLPSQAVQR